MYATQGDSEMRGQTDLEFLVEKILNRSDLAPSSSGKENHLKM